MNKVYNYSIQAGFCRSHLAVLFFRLFKSSQEVNNGEEVCFMKRRIRAIILVSGFICLSILFSALSCTVTPGGIAITINNGFGAGIVVAVYANDVKIADVSNGSATHCSVNAGSIIKIYSTTYSQWLLFIDGMSIDDVYKVTQPVSFFVKYNIFDLWYVEVAY